MIRTFQAPRFLQKRQPEQRIQPNYHSSSSSSSHKSIKSSGYATFVPSTIPFDAAVFINGSRGAGKSNLVLNLMRDTEQATFVYIFCPTREIFGKYKIVPDVYKSQKFVEDFVLQLIAFQTERSNEIEKRKNWEMERWKREVHRKFLNAEQSAMTQLQQYAAAQQQCTPEEMQNQLYMYRQSLQQQEAMQINQVTEIINEQERKWRKEISIKIIIDDYAKDKKVMHCNALQDIVLNGRHNCIGIYFLVQNFMKIPPDLRVNPDYIFTFELRSEKQLRGFLEQYCGSIFNNWHQLKETLNKITYQEYHCMVIKATSKQKGIENQIFDLAPSKLEDQWFPVGSDDYLIYGAQWSREPPTHDLMDYLKPVIQRRIDTCIQTQTYDELLDFPPKDQLKLCESEQNQQLRMQMEQEYQHIDQHYLDRKKKKKSSSSKEGLYSRQSSNHVQFVFSTYGSLSSSSTSSSSSLSSLSSSSSSSTAVPSSMTSTMLDPPEWMTSQSALLHPDQTAAKYPLIRFMASTTSREYAIPPALPSALLQPPDSLSALPAPTNLFLHPQSSSFSSTSSFSFPTSTSSSFSFSTTPPTVKSSSSCSFPTTAAASSSTSFSFPTSAASSSEIIPTTHLVLNKPPPPPPPSQPSASTFQVSFGNSKPYSLSCVPVPLNAWKS